MTADFTPLTSLLGGGLIGLAATLLLLLNGRIAGISGIMAGAIAAPGPERDWRTAFLVGLIFGPVTFAFFGGTLPQPVLPALPIVVVAGLLVGFGTRLGGGCTSGHGVCGLARLSPRSLAATATFVVAAMATVFLVRLLGGG
ncbi:MAG: YeeE/YedE family protein [Alphaproteobacteria bacterium]|nr:YeeE/YedE family protein [Alphaproteobacteria bacterium]